MQTSQPSLPLMEQFLTLQGEGRFSGQLSYFIRLAGCDVGCVWCDVKESWNANEHPTVSISDIAEQAKKSGAKIAVITGGEPLMHDLKELTFALKEQGMRVHLETSGAHPLSGNFDWICLSPKKFKSPLPELVLAAHELKVVVYHPSDLKWAEQYEKLVSDSCLLYLQPEWEKRDAMTPMIIDYIHHHPQWILSLQSHKYINIP